MRCLAIADALAAAGAACRFVCRAHAGHMADRVGSAGHAVHLQPIAPCREEREGYAGWIGGTEAEDARLTAAAAHGAHVLVVDHYGLGAGFESALRGSVGRIAAIEDLPDRPHACDLLLDYNLDARAGIYHRRVPGHAVLLLGGDHAPLRPAFATARQAAIARRRMVGAPSRALVAMGGFDPDDITSLALEACAALPRLRRIDVVLGPGAPHRDAVRHRIEVLGDRARLHVDVPRMEHLMAEADLAIGGGGVTAFERAAMGLPSVIVVLAENQERIARSFATLGLAVVVDQSSARSSAALAEAVASVAFNRAAFRDMICANARALDGRGLERIVPALLALAKGRAHGD